MKITKHQLRRIIKEFNTSNPVQIDDHEELLFQIAMKIKDIMPPEEAPGAADADFRSMVVGIYEDYFDPTGEGWEPYSEDLAAIEDHLTIVPIPGDDDYEQPEVYESKEMKITKRQLRRIIKEAIDPKEFEEPLGGWAGDALHNDPDYKHHTDTDASVGGPDGEVDSYDLGREDSLAGIRPQLPDEDYMMGYNEAQSDAGLPTMQAPSDTGRGKPLDPDLLKGALPGKHWGSR